MMIVASVSAFAATGADAFAATATVNVTIDGILAGDVVSFYKLGTPTVDANNQLVMTWTPEQVADMLKDKATEAWSYAPDAPIQTALAGLIADGTITLGEADFTSDAETGTSVDTDVAPGYYLALVRQGDASKAGKVIYQNMLINTIPEPNENGVWETRDDVTATVKKSTETLTKTQFDIKAAKETAETVDGYKFGDYIPFTITTNIPSYPENSKVATFEITDNPTGLKIVEDATHALHLFVNDTDVTTAKTATVNTEAENETYKITVADGNLKIEFDKAYILAHPNQAVKVTYFAELLGNDNDIEYDETNNSAKIKYNDNPDEETFQEPGTEIKQKTGNFTLLKHEKDKEDTVLAGAKFTLWTAATEGTQIELVKEGNVYRPFKPGEDEETAKVTYIEVDETGDTKGQATVVGLGYNTYYLNEDVAPAGYTRLAERQPVTVTDTTSTVGIGVKIPNTKGTELPETGGMGTTILYVGGSILVILAAVLLITKRRMNAND